MDMKCQVYLNGGSAHCCGKVVTCGVCGGELGFCQTHLPAYAADAIIVTTNIDFYRAQRAVLGFNQHLDKCGQIGPITGKNTGIIDRETGELV